MSNLFRQESIDHRVNNAQGKAFVNIPVSYRIYMTLLICITLCAILLVATGNYTRVEKVSGILRPSEGLIYIYATKNGVVKNLNVSEESNVELDSALLNISTSTHLANGTDYFLDKSRSIKKQLSNLDIKIDTERKLFQQNQRRQQLTIAEQNSYLLQLKHQIEVAAKLVKLKSEQFKHAEKMSEQGYLSKTEQSNSQFQLLIQQQELEQIKANFIARKNDLSKLKHELDVMPVKFERRLSEFNKQKEEFIIQLKSVSSNQELQIKSPIEGKVTAIQVNNGEQVHVGKLLMAILPSNAKLEAEIYLPSRAAGFIKKGQKVKLRYDAFPYQRYGVFDGTIIEESNITLSPDVLKGSINTLESSYRIRVELMSQEVLAFGQSQQLRAGMQLEADIVLDEMTLLNWFLMPLYSIKGAI